MRIVYVDVDSLRADHTEPYGYARRTTPSLQELAVRSVVFDRFYCSDSPCLPSRMAWASGQFGVVNGVVGHFGEAARFRLEAGYPVEPTRPLVGQWLRGHGYYTASVSMFADRHGAYTFLGNFRESIRASEETNDEDANDVNRVAQDWLRRHGREDNWLLHVNYWEPHTPYLISAEWVERAAESGPAPPWPDEAAVREHAEIYGPRTALDLHYTGVPNSSPVPHAMPDAIRSRGDVVTLMNGYDAAVMYWDEHLGALLRTLDELGIAGDTAIIVSGDHGESLGENGSYAEHGFANEPTHRLPLVICWPGITDVARPAPRRCDALLYNLDVAPTLCDLLGLPVPTGWHGTSFADAVRGDAVESRPYLVFGQGAHTYQRAVRTRDHLYIRTYHPGCFRAEWESLFDVTRDPPLTRNLIDAETARANEMRARLSEWWTEYAGRPGALPDPMQTTLQPGPTYYNDPSQYAQHLRDTRRAHLADDLEQRLQETTRAVSV